MAETIFGLALLWIATGMLAWPLLGGVWLRDDLGAPDWGMRVGAVVTGPIGLGSAVIVWLLTWFPNPRIAWLYGVAPSTPSSRLYLLLFTLLVLQIAVTGVLCIEGGAIQSSISAVSVGLQIGFWLKIRNANLARTKMIAAAQAVARQRLSPAQFYPLYAISAPPPPERLIDRDPAFDDTMGYRSWQLLPREGVLRSPVQGTPWLEAELHCEDWCESDVVRGRQGIHAEFVPVGWRNLIVVRSGGEITISGIVERFGKYVLGTDGWRAEWVMIRKLIAPNAFVAAGLRGVYPDIEVIIAGE